MRRAQINKERSVSLEAAEIERLVDPNQIRMSAVLSGVSAGTEMAVYRGTIGNLTNGRWGYWTEYPIAPGYELVGEVTEVGPAVTDVALGDRVVALAPHGDEAVVDPERYVRVPETVSDEDATFAILGATTTHGMRRAHVSYGETVLVLGLGVVGTLSAFHALRSGAGTVIVADPKEWKRALARDLGFEHVLDPGDARYLDQLAEVTANHRADLVIEASGSGSAFETCFTSVAYHGRILVQGTHLVPVPIDFSDYAMHMETTIISTWAIGSAVEPGPRGIACEAKENLMFSMELIRRGHLPVGNLVTHRFPFHDLPEVYAQIDSQSLDYLQIILNYGRA